MQWSADPELEWCPPGHGGIYPALAVSGTLDALLDAVLRYAFVSSSDNLDAFADARIAAWLAAEQVPFVLEAVRGTPADRKGGHLARYQGRMVLRESARVPDGDASFTDVEHWRWYNTNNTWIGLHALKDLQAADPAAPDLPLIVNRKTVDPRDPESTPVIQLESDHTPSADDLGKRPQAGAGLVAAARHRQAAPVEREAKSIASVNVMNPSFPEATEAYSARLSVLPAI